MTIGPPKLNRDERGWRIPREGSVSRKIYALTIAGFSTRQIADALNVPRETVSVLVHRFKNPERSNDFTRV